jgi:predicted DsbA family dithiol-disulfide isomerase
VNIDIWSDVVCPWCYVGKRRFETALDRFDHRDQVTVTWRSYQLDPTTRSTPRGVDGDYVARLAAKFGGGVEQAGHMLESMTRTAAAEGLDYHFDIAKPANTFDAHRLLHLAAQRGVQGELEELLFRATFTLGQPIGDHQTLVDLAAAAGLDRDEAIWVLAGDQYADAVEADEAQARAYGITGVPFFVIDGKYGVSGAQPAEALLGAMTQAWQEGSSTSIVSRSALPRHRPAAAAAPG